MARKQHSAVKAQSTTTKSVGGKKKAFQSGRSDTSPAFDPRQSRIKALKDWDESDMRDEEDEFFAGKDEVSLADSSNRLRASEYDLEEQEQLLAVESDLEEEDDNVNDDDDGGEEVYSKRARRIKPTIDNSTKGRFGKKPESESASITEDGDSQAEDESMKSEDEDEQLTDDGDHDESKRSESDDEEVWTSYHVMKKSDKKKKKRTHDPESIAKEAEDRALELEEVKRLQSKARSKLIESDYQSYFDRYLNSTDLSSSSSSSSVKQASRDDESRNQLALETRRVDQSDLIKDLSSESEAISTLLKTRPEALALVNDFHRSLVTFSEVQKEVFDTKEPTEEGDRGKNVFNRAINWLHYHVLSSYLSTTAFYMHLSLKTPTTNPPVLGAVTKALVDLRHTLNLMEQVGLIGDNAIEDNDSIILNSEDLEKDLSSVELNEELRRLLYDQSLEEQQEVDQIDSKKRKRKTELLENVVEKESSGDEKEKPKKKKKKKNNKKDKKPKEDLIEDPNELLALLPPRPSKTSISKQSQNNLEEEIDNDFIEARNLTETEANEKSNKKKNLRFYTSKIDAKGKRREKAIRGDGMVGGDTDLVYVTKEAQRRQFLQQENHKNSMDHSFDDDPNEFDGDDLNEGHRSMDYYNTVKEIKESAKMIKKSKHDETKMAERDELTKAIESGTGPREINRQMLKNKGLTPKRAKENRNPRVKKRLRFEKAKKKISSQSVQYKDEVATKNRELNRYSGERTGVKVGVKSRKL